MTAGTILALAGCLGAGPRQIATPPQDESTSRYTLEFHKTDGKSVSANMKTFEVTTKDGKVVTAKDGWLTVDGKRESIADDAVIVIEADGIVSVREVESPAPQNGLTPTAQ